ncbi:MAG: cation:proton antiporter regulatory subunit [Candidatus Dormibacteraceae bacterium]
MSDVAAGAVHIEEVELPGIGMRYDLMTHKGRRVGVVQHRSGRRDLLVFSREDPDACSETVRMTDDESAALGELLGSPRLVETLTAIQGVQGLMTEQVPIEQDSPFANRTLGETAARTRTGASIVAIIRGEEAIVSPTPDFRFLPGDGVVVVGTREGVRGVTTILTS